MLRFNYAPSVENFAFFSQQGWAEVAACSKNGQFRTVNVATARSELDELAKRLASEGTVLIPGLVMQETGFWDPAVVTDKDGKAKVTVTLPQRSTGWKLHAKGITVDTLAGESTTDVTAKKDLFGELKLPLAFTDGDEAQIPVVVHNDAIDKGLIDVVLRTTIGDKQLVNKHRFDVSAKGQLEYAFDVKLERPAGGKSRGPRVEAIFELSVSASDQQSTRDVVRRVVPLESFGMSAFVTASGSASSDTTVFLEVPKDLAIESPSLEILIGPTVERSLLDIVLGPAPWCQVETLRWALGLDRTTSDLMASVALLRLIGGTRAVGGPHSQALDERIRASVGTLVSAQNDDGGWSWSGRTGSSHRYASARVVWALSLARAAGYTVPADQFAKAQSYLQSQSAATAETDYETKAVLLHALTAAGQADFAVANRLFRNRPTLSNAALAYLALALAGMDRKPMASELLDLLAQRALDPVADRRLHASVAWNEAAAEVRALFCLALQEAGVQPAKTQELVTWLLAHRTGHRWAPEKATGPAALALAQWFAKTRFQNEHYKLAVFVNDREVAVLDIDDQAGTRTVNVPTESLKAGKNRINFSLSGRGRYTYQCILGGFVPAEKARSTSKDWTVHRIYEPAPLEFDGREVPRGFGILQGSWTEFRNPLTELPVGKRGAVELRITRHNLDRTTRDEELEYLVVTEPIPSGTMVAPTSVKGGFERFEIEPGAITFYCGTQRYIGPIHYELHGYVPGSYRAAPTVLRNAYRPEQLVVGQTKALAVLPLGATSRDRYRLTPQELFELGQRRFAKKQWKEAGSHLAELIAKWNVRPEVYKEAARMLLDIHLETGPAHEVVRYFEIVKEKWPELEIPFAKIVKVADAYHEIGEYERSYLVFRATAESSFSRETGVAGFLEGQGEFLRSVEVAERLLAEYPPEPYIALATYALAQQIYAKSATANEDSKLRERKVFRVDLIQRAAMMIDRFLMEHPEDPAADQAAFSRATALVELKDFKGAIGAADRYASRYSKSQFLDSFWYIIGFCHFATGEHERALEMCRKVAEATRVDPQTGRTVESSNKWRAIYIRGQVYHSLGSAANAVAEYQRVQDRFGDAKEAIDYFNRKAILLPEVTAIQPGNPVEVDLAFRNVAQCDVKVYRIDLMKFSLLERNLQNITRINLAGIRPYHDAQVTLGDGKDYRDRTHKLRLPLKEVGAYLVVGRGEDLHTSGLVLLTPLAIEIQEEAASGRVRATVKDKTKERYVPDVHVKVIGTRDADFVAGESDLRGVFIADGIKGKSTVIAQATGNRYAFYRGQLELGPPPPPPTQAETRRLEAAPDAAKKDKLGKEVELLDDLFQQNRAIQEVQERERKGRYGKPSTGVEAKQAF
jgi:tetratricopeptide (TPR) repeat protein